MAKSHSCLGALVKIGAYFIAALLILSLPLSLLAHNSLRVFFSPEEVGEVIGNFIFDKSGMREQFVNQIFSSNWFETLGSGYDSALRFLSTEDREEISRLLFPQGWLRGQLSRFLSTLFEWVESEKPVPGFSVDMSILKAHLRGGAARQIIEIVVDSWPDCTLPQELRLKNVLNVGSAADAQLCRPQDSDLQSRLVDLVDQNLMRRLSEMPEVIQLTDEEGLGSGASSLNEFKRSLKGLLLLLRWARLLPGLLTGLLIALAVRSWIDLGRWWGLPLAIGGMATLLTVLVIQGVIPNILTDFLQEGAASAELAGIIEAALRDLFDKALDRTAGHAIVLLLIGGGFFGATFFIQRRGQRRTLPAPVEPEMEAEKSAGKVGPPPPVDPFNPEFPAADKREDSGAGDIN
jgi:hypothetical protein